ncbi:hypothetical protein BASA81_005473 [Batrachochytrium salamandrivorans]|nr:hypothetical protein BASA81_005473 [Batrachochytrium salamandrivorans]
MRFSCQFSDNTREVICHILNGAHKLSEVQVCALVLTDQEGFEIRAVTDSASVFGKIEHTQFSQFSVQSKANNRIAIEVQIASLLSAFKISTGTCEQITFKLTKNKANVVCFSLSTRGMLTNILLTQDVPVMRLLTHVEMARYREPAVGDAQVTIAFPEAKLAKTVLDRMKNLGKVVQIKADERTGKLVFRMDTDVVSTRTVFDGLGLANNNNNNLEDEDGNVRHQYVVAQLNCKEFGSITSALALFSKRTNNTMLAIVQHCAVCVHVSFDDESHLTFYLATVAPSSTDEDDDDNQTGNHELHMETQQDNDL